MAGSSASRVFASISASVCAVPVSTAGDEESGLGELTEIAFRCRRRKSETFYNFIGSHGFFIGHIVQNIDHFHISRLRESINVRFQMPAMPRSL